MSIDTYLVAVDGGGSQTRVALATANGKILGHVTVGPSGLAHGIEKAWEVILKGIHQAFAKIDKVMPAWCNITIALGLAGVNNPAWRRAFIAQNPGFGELFVTTDVHIALLGAHRGQPGIMIILGTGSVGLALSVEQTYTEVGGWGFPSGDEASGAWLGRKALNRAQKAIDGRLARCDFTAAIIEACGGSREAMMAWLGEANQTRYATLAPYVMRYAHESNIIALDIVEKAVAHIVMMVDTLDHTHALPIVFCGGLAEPFIPFLPQTLQKRLMQPVSDHKDLGHSSDIPAALSGAFLFIKHEQ